MQDSPPIPPSQLANTPASLGYGIKLCPRCGREFNDNGIGAKVYCSIRCRSAARYKRAVARDKMNAPATQKAAPSENIIVVNPLSAQLDLYAKKLENREINAAVIVRGVVPDAWEPPFDSIMFVKQIVLTGQPPEWAMLREDML